MSQSPPPVRELLDVAVSAVGGAERAGQVEMAEAVAASIRTGDHLAVQAGTGTGKSLAYLVPAIRHAVVKGKSVVVSTATIALQRQLVDRDLPRLAKALGTTLGRKPTFAILKGRRNYLCLHRLDGPAEEPDDQVLFDPFAVSRLGREITRLREWASDTETGDRDELVPGVSDQSWRQVSVTARECLGVSRCPIGTDCFAERARAEAGKADVVVTNHALLAIDALGTAQVLPEHDVVIIDEAHDLVDRVTSVATGELSATAVTVAARRAGKLVTDEVADRLIEAGEGLAMLLSEEQTGRMDVLPEPLAVTIQGVRDAAHKCITAIGPERKDDTDAATARKLALSALDEVHDTAVRVLEAFGDDLANRYDVVWVTGDFGSNAPRPPTIRVAPLTVAGLLREKLFGENTTVLTSATLTLGGTFDALARQWGLPGSQRHGVKAEGAASDKEPGDEVRWTGMDVGSPFDHARAGILYTARHLPTPGRDGLPPAYLEELRELVTAAGGRTLGLFSSMRAAKQATAELRDKVGVDILCQGEDSTSLLVKKFAENPSTCLFGTLSLWQGVDVPGSSLSLVVMDRIPFPRPDDPLASARQRAVEARGGNGFLTVAATHAALLLAQGAGRLLRSMDDRGVVAILDPRLATARYGGFLRASLPPFWPTTDPDVVRAALRRLAASAD
ncbi:ATP-dependent DNA helicase [Actinokineospora auranticolor]|uniref:ATP-dependent helicase DinG n=1 Tax=Actinokineospora auranticolor TaxID=155976 RepID=A0A2S6GUK0_9PSEU|nr:ATP-dependent DNA helicase [Actinokineospora auranticolor]PPK68922.1 ATP-dependent DNA helicase DinG [Actinokineospora auranticolor]